MHLSTFGVVVISAAVAPLASSTFPHTAIAAFGINCEGSGKCHGQPGDTAARLVDYINGINPGRSYSNGEHIACQGDICAFLQTEKRPLSGEEIRNVAHSIVDHGCKVCGSVPTSPGNNVADGQLTFNYVSETHCGDGLCQ
ncbi:killer toxin Kp4/SMK [Mycena rebaudengoi]|nr:killer toxin Kp4/SMK [Mycena rebaudengoi]